MDKFSIFFPIVLRRDIGLYLLISDESSFLNKGETLASFHLSGKLHLDKE